MDQNKKLLDYDWLVKILIIGDCAVGKTQILSRFADNKYSQTHMPTLGVDFKIKTIQVEDSKIKMQVWDSAGQDRFRSITQTYYKGATGIIIAYSVADRSSFTNVKYWIDQIKQHAVDDLPKILVGNKSDLQRVVDQSEGRNLAESYGMSFIETSAKENINIKEIFYDLGKQIKQQQESGVMQQSSLNATPYTFNTPQNSKNQYTPSKRISIGSQQKQQYGQNNFDQDDNDINQFKSKGNNCSC